MERMDRNEFETVRCEIKWENDEGDRAIDAILMLELLPMFSRKSTKFEQVYRNFENSSKKPGIN